MLPFLLPLLGSILGPSIFTGMPGFLAAGLGSGIGSLVATRDPEQALLSAFMGGAGSGLGSLFSGTSSAAAQVGSEVAKEGAKKAAETAVQETLKNAAREASVSKVLQAGSAIPSASAPPIGAATREMLEQAANNALKKKPVPLGGSGRLGGLLQSGVDFAREHPLQTGLIALGGLGGLTQQPSGFGGGGQSEPVPEHRGQAGPQYGYSRMIGGNMTPEEYRSYGQSGGPHPSEFAFFGPNTSWETSGGWEPTLIYPEDSGGSGGTGGSGGQGDLPFLLQRMSDEERARRRARGFRKGGPVKGRKPTYRKGGPVAAAAARKKRPVRGPGGIDNVQAVVQETGEPVKLTSGEYVMSKPAVKGAGGTRAMDALHKRLVKLGNGQRNRTAAAVH